MKCRRCLGELHGKMLFCRKCGTVSAVRLSPDEVQVLLEESLHFFKGKDYRSARRLLEDLIELEPNSAKAHNNLGSVYLMMKQYHKAEHCFKKALFLDANLQTAVENLTRLNSLRKKKLSPREQEIAQLLAACKKLITGKKFEEAIEAYKRVIDEYPLALEAYNNLGVLHFQMRQYDQAEDIFVRGLEQFYVRGLEVDHQYFILKENLRKLREAGEEILKEARRPVALSSHLRPGEKVLSTIGGDLRLYSSGELRKNSMFIATDLRLLLLSPKNAMSTAFDVESVPYELIKTINVNLGIVRGIIVLTTPRGEINFSTLSKDEAKTAGSIVRSMMTRPSAAVTVDDLLGREPEKATRTAALLLKALNELDVLSDDEYQDKLRTVEGEVPRARAGPDLLPPPRRIRESQPLARPKSTDSI